jgi:Fur family iron response transcriptional regulator
VDLRSEVETRLCSNGVKPTPQRVEIAMLLLAAPTHMSADQILSELRAHGSSVSKATVYNTLNLLARRGIIREVAVDPSRLVYDSTSRAHHHFYNTDTGELIDIDGGDIDIRDLPELPAGTEVESVELVVRIRQKS